MKLSPELRGLWRMKKKKRGGWRREGGV